MTLRAIVLGAGGHAGVVTDALLASGIRVIGLTDMNVERHGSRICGCPVIGDDDTLTHYSPQEVALANGLGPASGARSHQRRALQAKMEARGWTFITVRHPSAIVSSFATVVAGAQVLAGSVVQIGATIGANAVVNTAAVIEHGVSIGSWAHIAPGAVVCGDVKIGANTLVGAGAVVRQGIIIGDDCIIGAGAVVAQHVPAGSLCMGVPARLHSVST